MAQANAQIGIARAAYFPTVTLSAAAGSKAQRSRAWFTWPSRFFSVGAAARKPSLTRDCAGPRCEQFRAQYDETVANYRQAVLTAFQQVEDNLASLRILSEEIQYQDTAVKSAAKNPRDRHRIATNWESIPT